jgi:acyl-CoA dehydrogenase
MQTNLETFLFGLLTELPAGAVIAGIIILVLILGYTGAPLWLWTAFTAVVLWGLAVPLWLWIAFGVLALVFNIRPLRRTLISGPLMNLLHASGFLPTISETERIALESGTTWIEGDFFSGKPDFKKILGESYPALTDKERAFLEGPTEELCRMTDDWDIHQRQDLRDEAWAFIKAHRFFGMVIPEKYGGHGFSANGMNAVITKIGSHSIPLAVDVMVPNSLGPGELLINYGTDEQKDYYLPRLADGREIPCFALTEPKAGSDAASITSSGELFKGDDGELYIRLNWEKRYITLGAVATVLGLAFRLRDPDNLLGQGVDLGITCGLIPIGQDGVVVEERHNPLGVPFINSPTEGHDVVVPAGQIIGGPEQAGNGWRMLMETLAGGRGVFLPALNAGGAKLASRVAGAYAVVRRQFGLPIGRFEAVEELLAPIGGLTYAMDAMSRFTCGMVDQGVSSAVISAIAKYNSSEFNRVVINHGMDLLGGKGIILGPSNLLGLKHIASPIAITVEGSNVITRSLITFGQGLIRSHPYALAEMRTVEEKDGKAFDKAVWSHVGMMVRNTFRCTLLFLTRGRLARAPVGGPTARYYRKLSQAAANFAFMADVALLTLGAALKKKEKLSGRFADILSWLYLATCALRKFEADGRPKEDLPFVHWIAQHALAEIQQSLQGIYRNLPAPIIGALFRGPIAWLAGMNPIGRPPSDKLSHRVAVAMQKPGAARDRLTAGMFLPADTRNPLAQLEQTFDLVRQSQPLFHKLRHAVKAGQLEKDPVSFLIEPAFEKGIINGEERNLLTKTEAARREAIQVDAFDLTELPVKISAQQEAAKEDDEGLIEKLKDLF